MPIGICCPPVVRRRTLVVQPFETYTTAKSFCNVVHLYCALCCGKIDARASYIQRQSLSPTKLNTAYQKKLSQTDEKIAPVNSVDPNCTAATCGTSTSIFEKTEDSVETETLDDFLERYTKWIQEYILTLLSKEATYHNEVDFSDYFWSYSFYNSAKDLPSKYGKRFHALDLTSFEAFEKHLEEELKSAYAQNRICPNINKMSCLSSVIKNMIGGDLPWTEPAVQTEESLAIKRKPNRNILYAILRVPRSEEECLNFVDDVSVLARSQNFINTLLPRAFFKEFHNRFRIQLNFVDMWYVHDELKSSPDESWNGTYAAPIGKVLHYLNGGRVLPLTKIEFVPPGLPSYISLLKLTLKANTSPKVTESKRMAGLVKTTSQKGLKISPETEDSFVHSIISGTTAHSYNHHKSQEFSQTNSVRNGSVRPFVKKEPLDNYMYSMKAKESPRKKKLKRKRKAIQEIKCEPASPQESSDEDNRKYLERDYETQQKQKFRSLDKHGKDRKDILNRSSQDELFNSSAQWRKPTGKKQPLTAPSKIPSSKLPLTVGHAFLAKVKHGNIGSGSKTEYVENLLKNDVKCSQSEAEKEKSTMREKSLKNIKLQLSVFLQNVALEKDAPEEEVIKALALKAAVFKDMIIINDRLPNIELVSLAQGLVNVFTCTLRQYESVEDIKEALENILLVTYESLNVNIMDHKYNSSSSSYAFHKCQLQILIKFELAWMWPGSEKETQEIRDDVLKLLNLISAYRKEPPIQDFVVNTLMDAYAEVQSTLLAAIFQGMAIPLPKKMRMMMSPAANDKSFPDDVSQVSSIDSSLSQLDSISVAKSNSHTQAYSQHRQSARIKPPLRNASYLSLGNPKKPVMIPLPKLSKSHKLANDSAKKKLALAVLRSSPKRVRRNLFDVKKHDKDELKNLMAAATASRFSRSPSLKFRSPCSFKSRSPRSPAYQRGSRSKRRLHMDDALDMPIGASPELFSNSGVICPESPSTPNSAYYKRTRMSTSFGSSEKNVIQESPEVTKTTRGSHPLQRVDSMSFYSTKNSSDKAVAWEKSGAKMMAARIKDSVDLTQSLLLNDLEFLQDSPNGKGDQHESMSAEIGASPSKFRCPNESPDIEKDSKISETHEIEGNPNNSEECEGHLSKSENGKVITLEELETYPDQALKFKGPNNSLDEDTQGLQNSSYNCLMESPYESPLAMHADTPCSSKSVTTTPFQFEVSPNNVSPNIEALIRSENFPPSSMILNQRSRGRPVACTTMLETPTKKVQFNFRENLINTPSPVRNMSTTPKSILK